MTILSIGTAAHECCAVRVHADEGASREFTAVTGGSMGFLCSRLSKISANLMTPSVRERAWALCKRLDAALDARDSSGTATSVELGSNGAVVVELNAPAFLLFFAIEQAEDDSGWGLATHKSSGGLIAGGPLSSVDCASVLGLILPPRRVFRVMSSAGSSRQLTVVV